MQRNGIRHAGGAMLLQALIAAALPVWAAQAAVREENFDREPADWEGVNNRNTHFEPRIVTQDFGYSSTSHAGGRPGEIGGTLHPAGEAAYYGYRLPTPLTLDDPMSASGKMFVAQGPGPFPAGLLQRRHTQ